MPTNEHRTSNIEKRTSKIGIRCSHLFGGRALVVVGSRMVLIAFLLSFISLSSLGQSSTKISLLFIGDIMQHDTQIAAAYDSITGKYDYTECFKDVKPVFEMADLTIGNLELSLGGPPYKGYPNFSAPDELVQTLTWSGVDVLVTANNHCLDRGKKGLQRTIAVLDTMQIPHTGTFVDSTHRSNTYPLLVEKNGFRISILNYTYGTNGILVTKPNIVNYIDTTLIASDIIKAKAQNPDFIVTFLHWGDEYQRLPNKSQKKVAEFCFRHGVKLVIGAHPHVLQPMEWRKENDQLVVYSLGNFVSGQSSRYKNGGGMLFVELERDQVHDSTQTTIKNAEYKLQYVYRDAMRKYHILPVTEFENDTITIREKAAQASIKEFASDSRKLFADHNISITERHSMDADSVYFIAYSNLDSLMTILRQEDSTAVPNADLMLKFYGTKNDSINGKPVTVIGEFFDKEIAIEAMSIMESFFPKAILVRRKWY